MYSFIFLTVVIFSIVRYCATFEFPPITQQFTGSPCRIEATGEQGVCTFLFICRDVMMQIQNGVSPQTCLFIDVDTHIVCCPQRTEETSSNNTLATKSKQKCAEYKTKAELAKPFGTSGTKNEYPHMAKIGFGPENDKQWLCAGTLISEDYILTAGHCCSSKIGEPRWIQLGLSADIQEFRILENIKHPNYKPPVAYNDIALIRIDRPVVYSSSVLPACLYTDNDLAESQAVLTGWGLTELDGAPSNHLLKASLDPINNQQCNEAYTSIPQTRLPYGILPESQICYGNGTSDDKDICQVDSGSPLQIKRAESCCLHNLIGVSSFGCGTINVPGVYTKVSYFIPWIESIIWP